MTPFNIILLILLYFGSLLFISYYVSRKDSGNDAFFRANKNSKWYMVAIAMIGTSLSGVTFVSVPGEVGAPSGEQFKYFQFILGNAVGFVIISTILLPIYYRMNLTSIYGYIEKRLGFYSYKTAASIFLISRTISSAFRLYLVVIILQRYVFDYYKIPFVTTVIVSLLLIFLYTYKSGLKTIIITDTLQTFFLVAAVILTIYFICDGLHISVLDSVETIKQSHYSKVFFFEDFISNKFHFVKQFLGGIFVTIAMTGLDQDLMHKNLSCKNIKEAQKNMLTFTGFFVVVNLFFLSLGALLYIYADKMGIAVPVDLVSGKPRTDLLFPEIALHHLAVFPGIVFLLGLIAATFASTGSALTALTTSFCVDFLNMESKENGGSIIKRHWTHFGFSVATLAVIIVFDALNDASVVTMIFKIASYTYGPLLGLYGFGIFVQNRTVRDKWVPLVCFASPFITFVLNANSVQWFWGYVFDFELILINGLICFLGLLAISTKNNLKD